MIKTKEKKVLLTVDNVRIKEYDSMNVIIERYETYYSPIDKENISNWRFKGYSSTVVKALGFISSKELLIGKKANSDLESYLKDVQASNKKILDAFKEVEAEWLTEIQTL